MKGLTRETAIVRRKMGKGKPRHEILNLPGLPSGESALLSKRFGGRFPSIKCGSARGDIFRRQALSCACGRWRDAQIRIVTAAGILGTDPSSFRPTDPLTRGELAGALEAWGNGRLRSVVNKGGFSRFRRAAETPFNLIFEARV